MVKLPCVQLSVRVLDMRERSWHVETVNAKGKKVECWIPRSMIRVTDCIAAGDVGYVLLTERAAAKLGLLT